MTCPACVQLKDGWGTAHTAYDERGSSEHDGRNLAPIVILAVMLGPAIAEQAGLVAIGAKSKVRNGADTGARKALGHIAGKVEMGFAGAVVGHEEGRACRLFGQEALDIIGPNLIGPL